MLFYPSHDVLDRALVRYIESNGGRNDITVVPMWVGQQALGSWSFLAACQGGIITDRPCDQGWTAQTVGAYGSQLSVAVSYQTTYASLPWQAAGQWNGVTLQKQFATAFQVFMHCAF